MLDKLDTYTLKARVAPIFLTISPLILLASLFAPKSYILQIGGGATLLSLALSIFGAQFSRDRGKAKEVELWESWGGHLQLDFYDIQILSLIQYVVVDVISFYKRS